MKSVTFLLLSFVFISKTLWACPAGMTEDTGFTVLRHIQDTASTSQVLRNAKQLPVGNYSCVSYQAASRCYMTRNESVSLYKNDSQVLVVFGRMVGVIQDLPIQDHDGVNHTYYGQNNRLIIEASLDTLDEGTPSETTLNYLDCKLIK